MRDDLVDGVGHLIVESKCRSGVLQMSVAGLREQPLELLVVVLKAILKSSKPH